MDADCKFGSATYSFTRWSAIAKVDTRIQFALFGDIRDASHSQETFFKICDSFETRQNYTSTCGFLLQNILNLTQCLDITQPARANQPNKLASPDPRRGNGRILDLTAKKSNRHRFAEGPKASSPTAPNRRAAYFNTESRPLPPAKIAEL